MQFGVYELLFTKTLLLYERSNLNCLCLQNKLSTTKGYKKVTHCLFDLDGTILDSEIIYHKVIQKICQRYGKKYTTELQNQLYGVTDRQLSIGVVTALKLSISVDEFEKQMTDMVQKNLTDAPYKDGAERLLWHLSASKIPIALVTNSTDQAVQMHAKARPKLFGLFHHKVCITDPEVKRGKPQPDMYLLGASRFTPKANPTQCLVFEDSVVGVEAAVRAKMQVVMVPDYRIDKDLTLKATIVLKSLLDLDPTLFGIPAFKDGVQRGR